jgi:hypothetical protein
MRSALIGVGEWRQLPESTWDAVAYPLVKWWRACHRPCTLGVSAVLPHPSPLRRRTCSQTGSVGPVGFPSRSGSQGWPSFFNQGVDNGWP